jgi:multicomponent K+:H+ antiporter subunit G
MSSQPAEVALWIQCIIAALLVASGALVLSGAVGIASLKQFFQRMHPPALASTFGTWCACAAAILWFSVRASEPLVHTWVIPILLCISVPITTLLLARAALFRLREVGAEVPDPLGSNPRVPPNRGRGPRRQGPGQGGAERNADAPEV